MFLSLRELIDMAVIIFAVGYIFSGYFDIFRKRNQENYDPLLHARPGFNWQSLRFAALVTAPAIILHELGQKFVAMYLGYSATFHAAYFWLLIGIGLKLLGTGFIFFVPAFVSHSAAATPLQSAAIAFAGPAVNLILWLGALALMRSPQLARAFNLSKHHLPLIGLTAKINMFLFFFNMIPVGSFDGAKLLNGLRNAF